MNSSSNNPEGVNSGNNPQSENGGTVADVVSSSANINTDVGDPTDEGKVSKIKRNRKFATLVNPQNTYPCSEMEFKLCCMDCIS